MKRSVYMVAIGGVGMSALANLFKEEGYHVTGSDRALYPPVSHFLGERGIDVLTPFDAGNIPSGQEIIVVGNAVTRDNPESEEARKRKAHTYSLPSALYEFFIKGKESIVVAGTHGKTTTTSMVAHVLEKGGYSPSFFVGGIPLDFNVPSRRGEGPFFVVEGDEYDSAYFDKKAKFFHYAPRYLILTGLEFDHADIYGNLGEIKEAFEGLVELVPESGLIIASADYPHLTDVLSRARCRVLSFSSKRENEDIFVGEVSIGEGSARSPLRFEGRDMTLTLSIPGIFNMVNAAAAVVLAEHLGMPVDEALAAMKTFSGVRRRQELLGVANGVTVVDDFAHHPTAVRETVAAVKKFYDPERLIAIFEPRSNTSRRNIFEDEYSHAFSESDVALLCPPHNASSLPEGERFSPERVCRAIRSMGKEAHTFESLSEVPDFLSREAREGDLFLFMSNGGMGGIQGKTLKLLKIK